MSVMTADDTCSVRPGALQLQSETFANTMSMIMNLRIPRNIRNTLTTWNDRWILKKAFVPRKCHFFFLPSAAIDLAYLDKLFAVTEEE